jgi:hypothetical protein
LLRVSLIGPGNTTYHYPELLHISKKKFDAELSAIAKALIKANSEIVLLPDAGAPFELASLYKKFGGKKVYASVPKNDTDLGINHLIPYLNHKIEGKNLFDKTINTKDWYRETFYLAMLGDVILLLGFSLGSIGELSLSYYMHKVFIGDKNIPKAKKKKINKEIRAGDKVPFSVIIYKPFVKGRLIGEIEEYIKKHKGEVYYVKNPNDLYLTLKKLDRR